MTGFLLDSETSLPRRVAVTAAVHLGVGVGGPALFWAAAVATAQWLIPIAVQLGVIDGFDMTGGAL